MLTKRDFIIRAAGATAAATAAVAYAGAGTAAAAPVSPVTTAPGLRTFLDGALVEQSRVVEWERRRISVAAARLSKDYAGLLRGELDSLLGRYTVAVDDIPAARAALAGARALIGLDGLRELVAAEISASEVGTRTALAASGGRWAVAVAEIVSDHGSAEGFVDWFNRAKEADDRAVWTDACPDHYIITTGPDGRQEVIEVTGGAVLASRFFVDYTDRAGVTVPADPDYPMAVAGTASLASGELIGSVCHQFRDEPGGGFRSQLEVAFPAAVPSLYIAEHQWHLACEFNNWITAYLR
ncbi:hypothetical protein FXW78_28330 [Rhodococcus opacus]|nr:hypothetical protein [Rhodococcus opacus]RZL83184.1 MAG: hypothetical protein EOP32_08600 [Rhodococcus sp. (in: high G+C Gram-positive bacteria)]